MNRLSAKKYRIYIILLALTALISLLTLEALASDSTAIYLPLVLRRPGANQSPTDIVLSNSSIIENQPINTIVGTLSTIDPNAGDTFTYSLVSGAGDTGNNSFNIDGNQLRSSVVFDYSIQNSYSVRIRSTDQGGLYFEEAFTITIIEETIYELLNGDFELQHVAWVESSSTYPDDDEALISIASAAGADAHSGLWIAWLGGDNNETSSLSQMVTVPAGSSYLHFWYWIASFDVCGYWDKFQIRLDTTQVYLQDLCRGTETEGWVEGVVDLSAYANNTYTLEFLVETDSGWESVLLIDDVSFSSSSSQVSR